PVGGAKEGQDRRARGVGERVGEGDEAGDVVSHGSAPRQLDCRTPQGANEAAEFHVVSPPKRGAKLVEKPTLSRRTKPGPPSGGPVLPLSPAPLHKGGLGV